MSNFTEFSTTNPAPVLPSGNQAQPTRRIRVMGVPLDLGASRRGVDMGPSAMRVAGLEQRLEALGHQVTDAGNIRVEIAETQGFGQENARYLKEIAETCIRTAEAVVKTLEEGMIPLVLGGDHSLAVGSVSGVAEFYRRKGEKIGVVWIDAHSDINTPETSPSGNVHGMPLAALLGLGPEPLSNIFGYAPKIPAENTVLVGVRDIDAAERENIRRAGVAKVYTMRDIDERGMRPSWKRRSKWPVRAPQATMCRWTWIGSTPRTRPVWVLRCAVAPHTARRTWPWKSWPTTGGF